MQKIQIHIVDHIFLYKVIYILSPFLCIASMINYQIYRHRKETMMFHKKRNKLEWGSNFLKNFAFHNSIVFCPTDYIVSCQLLSFELQTIGLFLYSFCCFTHPCFVLCMFISLYTWISIKWFNLTHWQI